MLSWLQKLFMSRADEMEEDEGISSSFLHSQHVRIIIAMIVVLVSGLVMWWILE